MKTTLVALRIEDGETRRIRVPRWVARMAPLLNFWGNCPVCYFVEKGDFGESLSNSKER